jgi:hypothetical protein
VAVEEEDAVEPAGENQQFELALAAEFGLAEHRADGAVGRRGEQRRSVNSMGARVLGHLGGPRLGRRGEQKRRHLVRR